MWQAPGPGKVANQCPDCVCFAEPQRNIHLAMKQTGSSLPLKSLPPPALGERMSWQRNTGILNTSRAESLPRPRSPETQEGLDCALLWRLQTRGERNPRRPPELAAAPWLPVSVRLRCPDRQL